MESSKRWRQLLTALLITAALCAASPSFAASSTSDGAATVDTVIGMFITSAAAIWPAFTNAAMQLFWILALIQFVWSGIRLLLSGDFSFFSFVKTVVMEIMFIGLFYWLLTQAPNLPNWIVANGLRALGAVSGYQYINPADAFSKSVAIVYGATKTAFTLGVSGALWAVVPYALTLVALVFSAAFAAVYLLEYYLVVTVGVILLGLGGSLWSKKFAENYVRIIISVGFKLTCLQIVLGISSGLLDGLQVSIADVSMVGSEGFFLHMFNLAGLSVLTLVAVKKLPDCAASLVSGAWFQSAYPVELGGLGRFSYASSGYDNRPSYSEDFLAMSRQEPVEFDDRGGRDSYLETALSSAAPGETAQTGGFSGGELSDIVSSISVSVPFSEMPEIGVTAGPAGLTEIPAAGSPAEGSRPFETGFPESSGLSREGAPPPEISLPESPGLSREGKPPTETGLPESPGLPREGTPPTEAGLPESPGLSREGTPPTEAGLPESPGLSREGKLPTEAGLPESPGLSREGLRPTEAGLPESPGLSREGTLPTEAGLPESPGLSREGMRPTEAGLPESPGLSREGMRPTEAGLPESPGLSREGLRPSGAGLSEESGLPGEGVRRGVPGPRGRPGLPGEPGVSSDPGSTVRKVVRKASGVGDNAAEGDVSVNLSGGLPGSRSERMQSAIRETFISEELRNMADTSEMQGDRSQTAAMQPLQRAVVKGMMEQVQDTGNR